MLPIATPARMWVAGGNPRCRRGASTWAAARKFRPITIAYVPNRKQRQGNGVLLDPEWTAAFAALGKTPTGWTTFIPSNFLVGVIGIWIYAKFRPNYGPGPRTALRSALSIWAVFWAIL